MKREILSMTQTHLFISVVPSLFPKKPKGLFKAHGIHSANKPDMGSALPSIQLLSIDKPQNSPKEVEGQPDGKPSWYIFFKDSFFFFWCGPFLKSLFVTILLLFCALVFWPRGTWDLSSLTRVWTCTHYISRWSLNHWTTREASLFCEVIDTEMIWTR